MKGGIMCLKVETENCVISFLDTSKLIMGTLSKLCESFKVPDQYCKSSIDHIYTKDNWK